MNIGEILSKAWKIIWKNKILWLFGILAGCSVTSMGSRGGGGGGGGSAANSNVMFSGTPTMVSVSQFISDIPAYVWVIIGLSIFTLGMLLAILFFMVGPLGVSGVIKGTQLAEKADPEDKPLSFKTLFNAIKSTYWKVLLFSLGYNIASIILVLIFFIPIAFLTVITCGVIWILFIPLTWLLHMMVIFTIIAIVKEEKGIFEAIPRAWHLVTKNLGMVILMSLILGVGQLILTLVISLPLVFSMALPVGINLAVTGGDSAGVGLIISAVLALILIPLMILIGGVIEAFVLSSWTLTFQRLSDKGELETVTLNGEPDTKEAQENAE